MKKLCLCFLALLACGCRSHTTECCNAMYVPATPVCCVSSATSYILIRRSVYVVSPANVTTVKSGNLAPEIYDPQPLPPLKIYHSHKSRPHHFVTENKQTETPGVKEAKPIVEPREPHKL